jgi:hypothetical protein
VRHLTIVALAWFAAPLEAQSPADSAAIRLAATDSGSQVVRLRIVADTAWVSVFDPRQPIDLPSDGATTAGTAVRLRHVRVERRRGRWTVVR